MRKKDYSSIILILVLCMIFIVPQYDVFNFSRVFAYVAVSTIVVTSYLYKKMPQLFDSLIKTFILAILLICARTFVAAILFNFFPTYFLIIDLVFMIFSVIIISAINNRISNNNNQLENNYNSVNLEGVILKCTKCNSNLDINDKFCKNCGTPFSGDNVKVELDSEAVKDHLEDRIMHQADFDIIFNFSEKTLLEEFIKRELSKANIDPNSKTIPKAVVKKKIFFNILFSVLIFIYISLIFFHFPIYTYIIGLVILIIIHIFKGKYNLIKYLKKQIKSRPSEKISNIIMNTNIVTTYDNSKIYSIVGYLTATILSLIVFANPRIIYEKMDNGYGVRFYTFGVTNFETVEIPATYKGENVVSLRGNAFSNMPFLESVMLPDTITEIRGQAFKNDKKLKNVKLPSKLEYLGGGAFYNCTSLEQIEIPDTVTYMGGEIFYNASSLKNVKLSNNITEIRGNSFENCTSLESIEIPDKVERIGGHAFYGNSSLIQVLISPNSKLREIGSSAFRECSRLYEITVPEDVYINMRAFKNSPTTINYYENSSGESYEH